MSPQLSVSNISANFTEVSVTFLSCKVNAKADKLGTARFPKTLRIFAKLTFAIKFKTPSDTTNAAFLVHPSI
jgi:hypothetical protein